MAVKTKVELAASKNALFADNITGDISAQDLRNQQGDVIDSLLALNNGGSSQNVQSEVDFDNLKFNSLMPFNDANVVLVAFSAINQAPTLTDTPVQVVFGAAQGSVSDPVMIDAAGKITYNQTGIYFAANQFRIGRTGSVATAQFILAYKLNGAWNESMSASIIDNADNTFTVTTSGYFSFTAGDYIEVFMIRDSIGNNDGGLFAFNPALAGIPDIPSCKTKIYKMVNV